MVSDLGISYSWGQRKSSTDWWKLIGILSLAALMPVAGQAGVIFDNFRGQVSVPGGSPAPNYLNYSGGNSVVQLQNLVNFASSTTNIASSGTAQNIDWNMGSATLCNSAAGSGWQSSAACQQWLQGRVVYAPLYFPRREPMDFPLRTMMR